MPTIIGTVADQQITDSETVDPFSGAMVIDLLLGEVETLTITLSDAADGVLTNLGGGTYNALTGIYTISGQLATINSALQGLVFRPTAHQAAAGEDVPTVFTITDTDTSSLLPATDATTSVVAKATAAPAAIDSSHIVTFQGIDYGPFQGTESPGGGYPTAAQIAADIPTLSGIADAIRLSTVSNGIGAAVGDAAADGLQVVPSAILVDPTTAAGAAANDDEINNLITLLNSPSTDLADIPFVDIGDDFLKTNPTQYNYLIDEIEYVRAHVPSSVKITTAETWDDYLTNFPSLGNQVDLVFADIDPFEQSTPVSLANAPGFVVAEYDALEEHYTGKNVVISGTGWPSAGTNGSDVGSVANEETFWTQFDALTKLDNISFFAGEAFDEPYKTGGGIDGPNAGLYNANRTAKGAVTTLVPVNGGQTFSLSAQPGNSLSLYNTGSSWDTVSGSSGSVYLSNALASVTGSGDHISFVIGGADLASLYGTNGIWDVVSGSNGTVDLTSSQASVFGGDDTINYAAGAVDATSLYDTGGAWDVVSGSNGTAYLTSAQASVFGQADSIAFSGGSGNAVSLYGTAGDWDAVNGSNGTVDLTSAQASVFGDLDTIDFAGGTGNAASLYQTAGNWDIVDGSGGHVYLTSAQASVFGGYDTVAFSGGTGNAASLYDTSGAWDLVSGLSGAVYLTSAQASVFGGFDTINFSGGAGQGASLYQTNGDWDAVGGSDGTVYLNDAQASVFGSADTIDANGNTGNVASLYDTNGVWDIVNGSNSTLYLISAQTDVNGGDDTINFSNDAGDVASLADTGVIGDAVKGSDGAVDLYTATATVTGSTDAIDFFGSDSLTLNGASETLSFQHGIGGLDFVNNFGPTDMIQLSSSDFANYAALASHLSQSGADTLITLDPNNVITLVGVNLSSLTSGQFSFT